MDCMPYSSPHTIHTQHSCTMVECISTCVCVCYTRIQQKGAAKERKSKTTLLCTITWRGFFFDFLKIFLFAFLPILTEKKISQSIAHHTHTHKHFFSSVAVCVYSFLLVPMNYFCFAFFRSLDFITT